MGFFDKLFNKSKSEPQPAAPVTSEVDKVNDLVYPMLKTGEWQGIGYAQSLPYIMENGGLHLAIVFAQDAGDRFEYITKPELEKPGVQENYAKWQSNIDAYPYEIVLAQSLDNRVFTASGQDFSAEKILSPAFLAEACAVLKTDRLIISAPRRRCLMATSYHEDFNMLENFFRLHFAAWREDDYGNEPITEMVFLADGNRVTYAVPLGFRINVYEKDGQYKLSYSTMDELFNEDGFMDFQAIIERNKIPVSA